MEYVTEINSHDVLFGRGSGPNDHEGNVRFRKLVAQRKEEYMATNHRMTKAKIAREIVDQVLANNGRFLKKMEAEDMKKCNLSGVEAWVLVTEDTIMEKAKQALRQNPNKVPKEKGATDAPQTGAVASSTAAIAEKVPQAVSIDEFNLDPIPIGSMNTTTSAYPNKEPGVVSDPNVVASQSTLLLQQQQQQVQQQAQQQQLLWQQQQQQLQQQAAAGFTNMSRPISTTRPDHQPIQSASYVSENSDSVDHEEPSALPSIPRNHRNSVTMADAVPDNLRGSISIIDLMRMQQKKLPSEKHSMEMSDLMDSFSKSKISEEEVQKKLYASTETMGTIEHIGTGSVADMSFGTINSSTFSFMKGNDSIMEDRPVTDIDTRLITSIPTTKRDDGARPTSFRSSVMSEASLSIAELRSRRRSYQKGTGEGTSGNTTLSSNNTLGTSGSAAYRQSVNMMDHPSLDLSGMGNSSVEMLRGMLFSSTDVDGAHDNLQAQQQQQPQQQQQTSHNQQQLYMQQQRQQQQQQQQDGQSGGFSPTSKKTGV